MKRFMAISVLVISCTSTHEALKNFFSVSEFVCHNLPSIEAVSIQVVPSDAGDITDVSSDRE